jgi:hypothetical protein
MDNLCLQIQYVNVLRKKTNVLILKLKVRREMKYSIFYPSQQEI